MEMVEVQATKETNPGNQVSANKLIVFLARLYYTLLQQTDPDLKFGQHEKPERCYLGPFSSGPVPVVSRPDKLRSKGLQMKKFPENICLSPTANT